MKYFFFCISFFLVVSGFSQSNYQAPIINERPFSLYLDEAFRNNFDKRMDTLGVSGFCWIKFKIDANGSPQKMEFSPGTHSVLSQFLKETLLSTNGLWKLTDNNQWLILPINYSLQKNGKTEKVEIDSYELGEFFGYSSHKSVAYIFLPLQEYVSPFDKNTNWGIEKLKTNN